MGSFLSIAGLNIPPERFFLVLALLVLINFIRRILDTSETEKYELTITDQQYQLSAAIVALDQDTLCPVKRSYGGIEGRFFYPIGGYWYPGQILKLLPFLKSLIYKKNSNISKNLMLANDDLDSSIVFIKMLNGIIFPILSQLLLIYCCSQILPLTVLTLISCSVCLVILDALFSDCTVCLTTRVPGLFIYTNIILLLCLSNSWMVGSQANGNLVVNQLVFIFSYLAASTLIFQTSQRYSQCFVVMTISAMIFIPSYRVILPTILVLSLMILINLRFTNFTAYVKTHIYNRFHDYKWSQLLYGPRRYQLFGKLTGPLFKTFVKCTFKFDYIYNDFNFSAFYKKNMASLMIVFRIYLYSIILIFISSKTNSIDESNIHLLSIIIVTAVVPAFICYLNPFQGYGAGEVYIWANLVPMNLIFSSFISSSSAINYSPHLNLLCMLYLIDGLGILVSYFWKVTKKTNILRRDTILGDNFSPAIMVAGTQNVYKMFAILSKILTKYNLTNALSIMAPGMHMFSTADMFSQFMKDSKGLKLLENKFTQIDNYKYGYFQDLRQFAVKPETVFRSIKPDLLLLDNSSRITMHYFKIISELNIDTVSISVNNIVVVSLNPRLNAFLKASKK